MTFQTLLVVACFTVALLPRAVAWAIRAEFDLGWEGGIVFVAIGCIVVLKAVQSGYELGRPTFLDVDDDEIRCRVPFFRWQSEKRVPIRDVESVGVHLEHDARTYLTLLRRDATTVLLLEVTDEFGGDPLAERLARLLNEEVARRQSVNALATSGMTTPV